MFVRNLTKCLLLYFAEKVEPLLPCCVGTQLLLVEQPGLNSLTGTKV